MRDEPIYNRYPKVPIERRSAAFLIDFCCVWLISSLVRGNTVGIQLSQLLVFIVLWLIERVLLVYRNQGQSLGRWALDMRVVDTRLGKTPGLQVLAKREGITGLGAVLAAAGLSLGLVNALSLILLCTPLAADCILAFADAESRQAFHDRLGRTVVVQTRRGYSLDLRIKKLFAQVTRRMRQ